MTSRRRSLEPPIPVPIDDVAPVALGQQPGVEAVVVALEGSAIAEIRAQLDEPLTEHTGTVYSVAWNQEGTKLAISSLDATVRIWDTETG